MVVILVVTLTVTNVSYIVVGYWFGEETDDGGDIGGVVTLTVTSVSYVVIGYWFGE